MPKKREKRGGRAKKELPESPVAAAVQLIGTKWKILLLCELMEGPKRFTELKTATGISQKVLTETLRALEGDALVTREEFAEVPPRVVYSLTELGETLRPVIASMQQWSTEYRAQQKGRRGRRRLFA